MRLLLFGLLLVHSIVSWQCTDAEVECVHSGVEHSTFASALFSCSGISKCVIMIKGGTYTEQLVLNVTGGPSFAVPGEIIPYPTEDVIIESLDFDVSAVIFESGYNYWKLHGGGEGGSIQIQKRLTGAPSVPLIVLDDPNPGGHEISDVNVVADSGSITMAIRVAAVSPSWDGLVFDNVRILHGSGMFDVGIAALFGDISADSVLSTHRLKVTNCEISETQTGAIGVVNARNILIESNYLWWSSENADTAVIALEDSRYIDVFDNMIVDRTAGGLRGMILLRNGDRNNLFNRDYDIRHNTFYCENSLPVGGVVLLDGSNDNTYDPDGVTFDNNLIVGCAGTGNGNEVFQEAGCHGNRCLGSALGSLRCNRADASAVDWLSSGTWTVDNAGCDGGAATLELCEDYAALPYPGVLSDPWMALGLVDDILGYDDSVISGADYRGVSRGGIKTPSIGGLEWANPSCFSHARGSGNECGQHGTCVCQDFCGCTVPGDWTGQECLDAVCWTYTNADPEVCTDGNGICIGPNNCQCSGPDYFGQRCDVPRCGALLNTDPARCNWGNGSCPAPPSDCTCFDYDDWEGPDCSVPVCWTYTNTDAEVCSNGHGICVGPNMCSCGSGWTSDDCSIPVCWGLTNADSQVCNGTGTCDGPNSCDCDPGWSGDCTLPLCNGETAGTAAVCNGNGECTSPGVCECDVTLATGEWCENEVEDTGGDFPVLEVGIGAGVGVVVALALILLVVIIVVVVVVKGRKGASVEGGGKPDKPHANADVPTTDVDAGEPKPAAKTPSTKVKPKKNPQPTQKKPHKGRKPRKAKGEGEGSGGSGSDEWFEDEEGADSGEGDIELSDLSGTEVREGQSRVLDHWEEVKGHVLEDKPTGALAVPKSGGTPKPTPKQTGRKSLRERSRRKIRKKSSDSDSDSDDSKDGEEDGEVSDVSDVSTSEDEEEDAPSPVRKLPTAPSTKAPPSPSTKAPRAPSTKAPRPPSTKAPRPPSTKAPRPPSTKAPRPPSTKAPAPPGSKAPPPPGSKAPPPPSTRSPRPGSRGKSAPRPPSTKAPAPPKTRAPAPPKNSGD